MENLPITLAGMTVFAPGAENAPSIPWIESEGYLHLQEHHQHESGVLVTLASQSLPCHQGLFLVIKDRCHTPQAFI
jgi:hypothetical protein